jgi:hypothetical protein
VPPQTRPPQTRTRRPDFIGIGAGKSGTTWLWEMLRRHPDVFLPDEKELLYFNDESYEGVGTRNPRAAKGMDWYLAFFDDARPGQTLGEISPTYLWSASAPTRVAEAVPDVRLFASLRDPAARVFSSVLFGQQKGEIAPMSFEQALEAHPYIVDRTMYGRDIGRWLDHFPREQLLVVFHHDIVEDPAAVLHAVEGHIGVDEFVPDVVGEQTNVTGKARYPTVTRTLMRARIALKRSGLERVVDVGNKVGLGRIFRLVQSQVDPYDEKPRMAPDTESRLRQHFAADVGRLETLLDVDLSAWKP